jgi:hypothetical protein
VPGALATYSLNVSDAGGVDPPVARERTGPAERPHWWGVLAVALALMALVATLSASHHGSASSAGRGTPHLPQSAQFTPTGRGSSTTTTGTGSSNATGHGATTSSTPSGTQSPAAFAATVSPNRTGPASSSPTAPVPTTGQSTIPPTTSSAAAPQAETPNSTPATTTTMAEASVTYPGNLEYPGSLSAQYSVQSGGGATVTASWSGTPSLTLSVECPGGQQNRAGASPLNVSVTANGGTCLLELAEPATAQATVSFVLDVQYPNP